MPREIPEQRDRIVERGNRKPPRRLEQRPEEGGEQESVERERDRVANADGALGEQHVDRERNGPGQRGGNPEAVERQPVPHLHHEGEAGESERSRDPDPPPHVPPEREPHPECDQQRRQVLDQQGDPDREALDREEVEPLHEGQACNAVQCEERQFPPPDPEPVA
jgi:hypothetical protein